MVGKEGMIDLNTATEEQLAKLPMVGPERARQIVEYRNRIGKFKSVDDLKNIPGFEGVMAEQFKQYVTVK